MRQLIIPIILVLCVSCGRNDPPTLDYTNLGYDTNRIMIFKWDTTEHIFSPNSDPLPLTQHDLFVVDSLLRIAIVAFNINVSPKLFKASGETVPLDFYFIDRKNYKYQYMPYEDVNGKGIMYVVGFSRDFPEWKTKIYPSRHGMRVLSLRVNLTERTCDDLYSGNFDCF